MTFIPRSVEVRMEGLLLEGILTIPEGARSIIVFAHGSGSTRHSPRNAFVARVLNRAGFATLLFDLLTPLEESRGAGPRFDIELLADRLVGATDWLSTMDETRELKVGYFGASTGAAAALVAASRRPAMVRAVVSRGGRPDLARDVLSLVEAPTRLIVGGNDPEVLDLNEWAKTGLRHCDLVVVPGATHLFEEPGKLQKVATSASAWFRRYLPATSVKETTARARGAGAADTREGHHAHAAS